MIEIFVEFAPAYFEVAKWHAEFTQVHSSCDDLHQCGRLLTAQQLAG